MGGAQGLSTASNAVHAKMQEDLQPFWYTTIRLRAPPSVSDNAPPDFVQNNPEMLSAFSTILSERKASKREFFL